MTCAYRLDRGMALILALVSVVIISMLLGGALLLSVSHFSLSNTNSSYANAMNLAEAGINWELWKISRGVAQADQTPATVQVPTGSGRSFTVRIEAYPGGGAWTAPSSFWVISTGTVDGVSRTVRVVSSGSGLSGLYAMFGIDQLNVGGNATIVGAIGANGYVDINGGPQFDGNFWYCGSAAGDEGSVASCTTGQVYHSDLPEYFPTVNMLANQRALEKYGVPTTLGVDFFANALYNDNKSIVDVSGEAITIVQYKLGHSTFSKAATDENPYLVDGVTPNPLYKKNVIVLGPGDYYFESMDVVGNNGIKIDTANGVVNVWLGPSGGGQPSQTDTVDGACMFFTGHDSTHFHLYQGSQRSIRMNGTMDFYGNVYAYNGPDGAGDYYGSIKLLGDGNITGSVIGYDVAKTTGSATITFPSSGGTGAGGSGGVIPGEPVLFYGFDSAWEELNAL